jgi:hypothetical protein
MRTRLLAPLLLSLFLISSPSIAGASISVKAAAKQYLKDVAPTNVILGKFGKEAGGWTNSTTDAQAEKEAAPVVTALRKLQNELLNQSWPARAKRDVRDLYTELAPMEADLETLDGISLLDVGSWESKFATDETTLSSDVNFVRHDLGLPLTS